MKQWSNPSLYIDRELFVVEREGKLGKLLLNTNLRNTYLFARIRISHCDDKKWRALSALF